MKRTLKKKKGWKRRGKKGKLKGANFGREAEVYNLEKEQSCSNRKKGLRQI